MGTCLAASRWRKWATGACFPPMFAACVNLSGCPGRAAPCCAWRSPDPALLFRAPASDVCARVAPVIIRPLAPVSGRCLSGTSGVVFTRASSRAVIREARVRVAPALPCV